MEFKDLGNVFYFGSKKDKVKPRIPVDLSLQQDLQTLAGTNPNQHRGEEKVAPYINAATMVGRTKVKGPGDRR